jgi:hypothetical protein
MAKFAASITKDQSTATVIFKGVIDETASFDKVKLGSENEVNLDLGKVEMITSNGIRIWLKWLASLDQSRKYSILSCSTVFINQANLISGLIPKWMAILSVELPYYCEKCGHTFDRTLKLAPDSGPIPQVQEKIPCPQCDGTAEFEAIPERYFHFLKKREL